MSVSAEASSYYKKAVGVDTKLSFCRYWKELALEKLGRKAEAQNCFQTSLDLKNDNLWSKFMLETLK